MKTVRLRAGKERSLLRRHPWVFEGSVDKVRADSGETVRISVAPENMPVQRNVRR